MTVHVTPDANERPRVAPARSAGDSLRGAYFASPLYRLRLIGRNPDDVAATPPDPWPGNLERGTAIIQRSAVFQGEPEPVGDRWVALNHEFSWLGDLRAVGSDEARRRARQLVRGWIQAYGRRPMECWRPEALGERVVSWLSQYVFFCASADYDFRMLFFRSLARQARHLARTVDRAPPDARRLMAIKGMIYGAVCLPGFDRLLDPALARLDRELDRQVLPDGGHFERSPAQHLAVLRDLVDIRATLAAAQREIPQALQGAIDRMAPALRAFRHGDGGLALFNGSLECETALIDLVLDQADARGRAPASLPHTGFQRLASGDSVIIIDTGEPPPPGADALAHAGTLSFEMSVGAERLIVNCGAYHGTDGGWLQACRATAAHSTLVVDDTNSSEVTAGGGLGRRVERATCGRKDDDGAMLVETSHDGYARRSALVHRRRLRLSAGGRELDGQDRLSGEGGRSFALRFHFHPSVAPTLDEETGTVVLELPSGARWHLVAAGGDLALEESVYLGPAGYGQRTKQAVVAGPLAGAGTLVKWRLTREDA